MRRMLLICISMLMLTIVTDANRPGSETALGATAMLKVASRVAAMGIIALIIVWTWSDPRRGAIIRLLLPWWAFGAWAVVSAAWSPLKMFSIGQSVSLVVLLTLSYCIAIVGRRIVDTSSILLHLSVMLLLLSGVLIVANIVDPDKFGDARETVTGGLHPTNAGATAGLGLVVIVWARLSFAWKWTRWLIGPSLLIHSVAMLLALNRASIIVTTLVVGGIVLLYAPAGARWLSVTISSFACAVYVTIDPGFLLMGHGGAVIARFIARDQSAQQLASLSGREEMWSAIWGSFLRSPWVGHGYFVSSESGSLKVWYMWSNWTAHNFWLQTLVGTGLIGGALLAWALLSYVVQLSGGRSKGVGLHRLVRLGIAVLVWQSMWGFTNESFVGPLQAESIVFFVVLGLVAGRSVFGTSTTPVFQQDFNTFRHQALSARIT